MTISTASTRERVQSALHRFLDADVLDAATDLLAELGYKSDLTLELTGEVDEFIDELPAINPGTQTEQRFREEVDSIKIIHQVTDEEIGSSASTQGILMDEEGTFDKGHNRSFIFVAVQLLGNVYSRGQYAEFTREINKRFASPCVVVFKTPAKRVTLAFVNRREHKRDKERDVLGNVSLIRQVEAADPHRAHLDILCEMSLEKMLDWMDHNNRPTNFDGLLAAWLAKLDTQELNKSFYRELFDWFERAVEEARFPTREAKTLSSEVHVMRLITRLLFVWFIKEKGLVAEQLFTEQQIKPLLKDYDPIAGDSYYRAVLQNLFFGTLNTEIDNRGFSNVAPTTHRIFSRYRYKREMSDPKALLALFDETPFINGGLFDCLDTQESTRAGGYRIDCFTDNVLRKGTAEYGQLSIPNRLFFDDHGLITLFERYKFTVEENTPTEQEVALDPELLGSVFENLLAAINPETKEAARKQTGSYYTPRPVVDYMVDEALVASLSDKVRPTDGDREFLQDSIRYLLDFNDAFNDGGELFDLDETSQLVDVIANLKVLDPAVGSGAFPMGVLHKLTLALRRIDPNNLLWEDFQKELAGRRATASFDTRNQQEREAELREISDTFERYRESDFGRKLYLIQNSIFGVDRQAIACQIAKLRFFISLAIEQEVDSSQPNYGFKPLPNLETRLIAANTLIDLQRSAQLGLGQTDAVQRLHQQLAANRERHFHASSRRMKQRYIQADEDLRAQLASQLTNVGMPAGDAALVANWKPYDQNATSPWFNPQYMFGIPDGFDITIGNPPYVRAETSDKLPDYKEMRQEISASGQFETLHEKWDLYIPFIEKSYNLLKLDGFASLIVSDAYCHARYATKSRTFLLERSSIRNIDFLSKIRIFEAGVHNVIYLVQNKDGSSNKPKRRVHFPNLGKFDDLATGRQENLSDRVFFPEDNTLGNHSSKTILLRDICYVTYGLRPSSKPNSEESFVTADLTTSSKDSVHNKPFVEGKHLDRWLPATNLWLEWGTNRAPSQFYATTFDELYEVNEKILVPRSPGPDPKACYDDQNLLFTPSSVGVILWHDLLGVRNRSIQKQARYVDEMRRNVNVMRREAVEQISRRFYIKFLLGILNSSVARNLLRSNRRSNIHLYPDDWKALAVPDVATERQLPVTDLVDRILKAKNIDPDADTSDLEAEIDELVYQLYGLTDAEIAAVEGRS